MEKLENKNPGDNDGYTPLHDTALGGHLEVCRAIMEKLENKNPRDNFGETPKDMAHTLMIMELFSNSSDHTFALCTFLFLFLTEVVLSYKAHRQLAGLGP